MANNVTAKNSDGSSYTFATDEIGGVQYQYVKPAFGPDDTATIVSTSNGLPVQPATSSTWVLGAGSSLIGSVSQSGTWNITNVSGTVSLPTGASTAAKQPALGTAGSASTDVITIQGISSMTALVVSDGAGSLTVDNGGTFATQSAQSGTWTVQPGNTPNTSAWLTSERPATSGGCSTYLLVAGASSNVASVKASAGQVYSVQAFNNSTNIAYLKLFDKASAPTSSDTPVKTLMIPVSGGLVPTHFPGTAFGNGIAIAVTNGIASNDFTAVAASAYAINIDYK